MLEFQARWSPQQKSRLADWVVQNDPEKKGSSYAGATSLGERAKEELGDVLGNRSARAISIAIMKIYSFETEAKLDEWTKQSGI